VWDSFMRGEREEAEEESGAGCKGGEVEVEEA
jgi:hypothetical protein